MKIKTEKHPAYLTRNGWVTEWSAWDEDTYDGAPDSHCPVGSGRTELEAVIDLTEQIIEKLETQLDRWIEESRKNEIRYEKRPNHVTGNHMSVEAWEDEE